MSVSPNAIHKGDDAVFTISAPGNCRDTMVVYSMQGKAREGIDYTLSDTSGQVLIPANQTSATVTLHALSNARKKDLNATFVLQQSSNYTVSLGTRQTKVTILRH
jgi:hypothetical protein